MKAAEARQAALHSPEAVQERAASVTAFTDLGPGGAADLFLSTFDKQLAQATPELAQGLRQTDDILAFRSPNVALVDPAGPRERALHVSTSPLLTEEGRLPDLDLGRDGNEILSGAPLADATIPNELADGLELTSADVSVRFEGARLADHDSMLVSTSGQSQDKEVSFYPEALPDTDIAIAPITHGVETFAQLRSQSSPETLTLQVDGPDDSTIEPIETGGAVLRDKDGRPVAAIERPTAVDAQGASVPVTMEVEGNELVLHVPHRSVGSWAYPLLVDPIIEVAGTDDFGFAGWSASSNYSPNYQLSLSCNPYALYSCNGVDYETFTPSAHVWAPTNGYYYYPADAEARWT